MPVEDAACLGGKKPQIEPPCGAVFHKVGKSPAPRGGDRNAGRQTVRAVEENPKAAPVAVLTAKKRKPKGFLFFS